jgi:hypothetical protein
MGPECDKPRAKANDYGFARYVGFPNRTSFRDYAFIATLTCFVATWKCHESIV